MLFIVSRAISINASPFAGRMEMKKKNANCVWNALHSSDFKWLLFLPCVLLDRLMRRHQTTVPGLRKYAVGRNSLGHMKCVFQSELLISMRKLQSYVFAINNVLRILDLFARCVLPLINASEVHSILCSVLNEQTQIDSNAKRPIVTNNPNIVSDWNKCAQNHTNEWEKLN